MVKYEVRKWNPLVSKHDMINIKTRIMTVLLNQGLQHEKFRRQFWKYRDEFFYMLNTLGNIYLAQEELVDTVEINFVKINKN